MKKKVLSLILALSMVSGLSVVPALADEAPAAALVGAYDTLMSEHTCETSDISTNLTVEDGAPDGTKYIKTGDKGNNKYDEYCFQSEFSYGENTKADIMFSLDIKFEDNGSGLCAEDNDDKKVAGAVKMNGGKLAIQNSGSGYTTTSLTIDTTVWYHIAMVGRYSASDANVDMYVWQYNSDGTMEYVLKQASIPLRNLAASNNNGASHLNILPNTCVDNMRVYKLGADAVSIESGDDKLDAGASMLFTYSATRAGEYITNPEVTWEIYNSDDTAVLEDENISISEGGLLTVKGTASKQTIYVRATTADGVYDSKEIAVNAIDTSTDTYDTIILSTEDDKNTVRVGEPLAITATATLEDNVVTPGEGDVIWKVFNEGNLRELGNKNITIDDGVLSVTEDAIPQTVTVKAVNKSGSVSGTYQVSILPANMNSGNEDLYADTFVSSNACEEYGDISPTEGSWDGSGYYDLTAAYDFVGFPANTNEDVIYSADMRFAKDGAGWTVFNSNKGKLGLQLSSSGTTLNAVGASNKTTALIEIDNAAWYNIQVMCATGNSASGTSYARFIAYKYDENGNKVNPKTGEAGVPFVSTSISLRNLDESTANHVNINGGTHVDNVMSYKVAPDKLTISVDAETVLAGGTAQASTTASRKGVDFPFLSSALIKYEIYDADNKYPLSGDKVTVDANGKITVDPLADAQDVYVRVSSTSGGMYDAKKLVIKSSDIFEVNTVSFDENYSTLKRINVTKSFNYSDDVTFIAAAYNAGGVMQAIETKKLYGDQLSLGENKISMDMAMPQAFDQVNDRLNVFVLTKLSTSTKAASLTATANGEDLVLSNLPSFDPSSQVVILVLKADTDDTKVADSDILYFNQLISSEITENTYTVPGAANAGVVKVCGRVGGMQIIADSTF